MVPPLRCCFPFLLKFLALRKFTTTGVGYGLLTKSNPVGSIMFVQFRKLPTKIKDPRRCIQERRILYLKKLSVFGLFSKERYTTNSLYCQCWKRFSRNVARNEPSKRIAKRYQLKQTSKQTKKTEIAHKTDWQPFLNKTLNTSFIRACLKLETGIHSLRNLFKLVKDTCLSEIVSNNTINPTWRVFEKVHQHKRIYHNIKLNVWWESYFYPRKLLFAVIK